MGVVVVETVRVSDGALLVATAKGGSGVDPSSAPPFAFETTADGRFIACLCDGSGDRGEGIAASRVAAREAVIVCARPGGTTAESISRGLVSAHEEVTARSAGEHGAACSAVLVVVADASVQVGWVGALEAIVLRRGEVVHRTVGMASPGRGPGVDLAGPWRAEPGDLVLLCSAKVHQVLSEADVTALASRDDVAAIVRGLVTTTSTRGEFFALCAIAIRIVVP